MPPLIGRELCLFILKRKIGSQLRLSFHSSRFQKKITLKKKPISQSKTKSRGYKIQPTLIHSRTWIGHAVRANLKGRLTSRFPEFVWRTWKCGAGTRRPGPVPRNLYTQHASSVVLFQVSRNPDAVRSGQRICCLVSVLGPDETPLGPRMRN